MIYENPHKKPYNPNPRKFSFQQKRFTTIVRYGFRCSICGFDFLQSLETFFMATVDHFYPRRAGGSNHELNRQSCCMLCNWLKAGDIFESEEEARQAILERRQLLLDNYHRFLFRLPKVTNQVGHGQAVDIVQQIFDERKEVPA